MLHLIGITPHSTNIFNTSYYIKLRLHDTTCCQTGCQAGLTAG